MQSYPLNLLKIMKRRAEDLLLANREDASGRRALTFVLNVAGEKDSASRMAKGTFIRFIT